jgi:acetamidase/formamidase
MIHELPATPATCFWGFFDAALPPVLRVRSGDLVRMETLTHPLRTAGSGIAP